MIDPLLDEVEPVLELHALVHRQGPMCGPFGSKIQHGSAGRWRGRSRLERTIPQAAVPIRPLASVLAKFAARKEFALATDRHRVAMRLQAMPERRPGDPCAEFKRVSRAVGILRGR